MSKTLSIATAILLLSATATWAQSSGSTVAPVTAPQATGSTVQGTSDAAKAGMSSKPAADPKAMPAPAAKDEKKK